MIQEGLYSAQVWHQRLTPKPHRFQHSLLMVAMNLAKLEQHCAPHSLIQYNRPGLLSLRSRDHFPGSPNTLAENIEALLPTSVQRQPHRVLILTQLAHFGFAFNPISFFVLTTIDDESILGVILEVHNTPWGERHYYPVFDLQNTEGTLEARFAKALHVSPFMSMDFTYRFSMRSLQEKTVISLDNWRDDTKYFSAGVTLTHSPLEASLIKRAFLSQLFSPHKVVAAIYWQALKLWLKGVPFYSHPLKRQPKS